MAGLSKRLRYEILRRDKFRCRYCGAKPEERELRVDHVIPAALGGKTDATNLVTACDPCNSGKSSVPPDSPLVEEVNRDALRWARAMEIATAGDRAERDERNAHREAFKANWEAWTYSSNYQEYTFPLPPEWRTSIDAFIRAGLDDEDLEEAVDIAMAKKNLRREIIFNYFCGICWRVIERRRETAAALVHLVDDEEAGNQ